MALWTCYISGHPPTIKKVKVTPPNTLPEVSQQQPTWQHSSLSSLIPNQVDSTMLPTDQLLSPNLDLPEFKPVGRMETDAGIRRYAWYDTSEENIYEITC